MDDLEVVENFPGLSAAELWAAWTTPDALASFWCEEAEVVPVPGGPFRPAWPSRGWVLDGEVLAVGRGRAITFSWAWRHEPERPLRRVTLLVEAQGHGSRLVVRQGPYGSTPDEVADITDHEAGWRHFSQPLRERS